MSNEFKKKRIEEMDKDIGEAIMHNSVVDIINGGFIGVNSEGMARELYDEGYRKQEWISVDERLPEENGRYLTCVNISHLAFTSLTIIAVMEYGKNHGFYLYSEDEPVTHWMPLPEPPKMKGGAE